MVEFGDLPSILLGTSLKNPEVFRETELEGFLKRIQNPTEFIDFVNEFKNSVYRLMKSTYGSRIVS